MALSLDDIGEAFEVSRRTAERLRDALREAFPQIEELVEPSGRKRWRLPPGTIGRPIEPSSGNVGVVEDVDQTFPKAK